MLAPAAHSAQSPATLPVPPGAWGSTPHVRDKMRELDAIALTMGREIERSSLPPAELRELASLYRRRGLEWLAGSNEDLARALERDVRLAALPHMIAAASVAQQGNVVLVNWYSMALHDYLDAVEALR